MFNFLVALILTISIETTILQVLNSYKLIPWERSSTKNIIFAGIMASSLTLPYLYFVLPIVQLSFPMHVIVGEIGVTLIEAVFYMFFFDIDFKRSLIISFLANFISFITWVVLFW